MQWTTNKPKVPGVYFRKGHYIGRPNLWEVCEIHKDESGELVVSGHEFSPERVHEMDPLEDFSEDFSWWGPMGPMPTGARVLEFAEPRRRGGR